MILPLNDDMIIHVAPASAGAPVGHLSQAFVIPKNAMVKINAAIWHLAPLPVNQEQLTAMIILPECTYANDCTVVDLPADQQFEIVL
jgi:ureidoglycolate lyase